MPLTKRIDLNLGYTCNLNCRFCYYQKSMVARDRKLRRDLTTEEAKSWLRFFRGKGKEEIDLTGGEPTIRQDIVELVRFCRETGYKKICLITNGIRLADRDFSRELVRNGLNDVLFSLHGADPAAHDRQTQTEGSFAKLLGGIENLTGLGVRCRSNTVVNGINYRHLTEIAGLLSRLKIGIVNFILFNPVEEARGSAADIDLRYRDAAPYLKEVIDEWENSFARLTIRYFPLCLLQGYESHIVNSPQVQYDPEEWDYYWRSYFRRGFPVWFAALVSGFLLHPAPFRLLKLDFETAKREAIIWTIINRYKTKGPQCRRCSRWRICDGLWRDYAARMGFGELVPVPGERISDPNHFLFPNSS